MRLPVLKAPVLINIFVVLVSMAIGGFSLLFGFAHVIEGIKVGRNPNIPLREEMLGWTFVILLCIIGVVFLVITIAAIRGILDKVNKKSSVY